MSTDFDVCVIGSGAGGGPVAFALAMAGYRVVVLEKGPWLKESDVTKDEIGECRRAKWTPKEHEEPRVVESLADDGKTWLAEATPGTAWDLWNATAVGGATNRMSGFFVRMQPEDFRLRSAFGPISGADVVDWPIGYDDLEPYYDLVEKEVGVSGRVVAHPRQDRRSSPDFPMRSLNEHAFSKRFDDTTRAMGLHPVPLPRAILSRPRDGRDKCSYSGFCGSYGCATGAKGSSRAALLGRAVATGRCDVRTLKTAQFLETDASGRVVGVRYRDPEGRVERLDAKVYVVACQPIESVRLMLLSTGARHPNGLGNAHDLLGRCLLSSPAGVGWGTFPYARFDESTAELMRDRGAFVNRTLMDWQVYADPASGARRKGGNVDFLLMHPNPILNAMITATGAGEGSKTPMWGPTLQRKVLSWFRDGAHLKFETFADWLPMPDARVTLDPGLKDKWGSPVARVRFGDHPAHRETTAFLSARGAEVLKAMGAEDVRVYDDGGPSTNLVAGGTRFGTDPRTSVLDPECRVHDVDNLYVTDGGFMPTGGSVPYTWTIYANSFRVADRIVARLGGAKTPPK